MELKYKETTIKKNYEQEVDGFKYIVSTSQVNESSTTIDMQIYRTLVIDSAEYIGNISLDEEYKSVSIKKDEDILAHLILFEDFLKSLEE